MPLTLPAHASLLTGTFPAFHGVRDNGGFYLATSTSRWPRSCRDTATARAASSARSSSTRAGGIAQGFDALLRRLRSVRSGHRPPSTKSSGPATRWWDEAIAWLGQRRLEAVLRRGSICTIRTRPMPRPRPFSRASRRRSTARTTPRLPTPTTRSAACSIDLAATGELDRTVIVVVGDHGESLGEHQEQTHGFFVYDGTLQIPLIIAGPGCRPARSAIRSGSWTSCRRCSICWASRATGRARRQPDAGGRTARAWICWRSRKPGFRATTTAGAS